MGKGDKKTAKGKRAQGSYGITRQRKKASTPKPTPKAEKKVVEKAEKEVKPKKAAAPKKTAEKKETTAKKTTKKVVEKADKK